MNLSLPLSEIMTATVRTVNAEDKIKVIKEVFDQNFYQHIPVTHDNRLIGIVSYKDFLHVSYGASLVKATEEEINSLIYHTITVSEIMTKNVFTLKSNQTISDAISLFETNKFHAIPIVEREKLVGIVTTFDLIKYMKLADYSDQLV
ncbi:CBS domain-containing protein [Flexithrix dorotheae]|uniref:CBS domain-containing protein n=1 Tax=Flexithrix dorotheae TaxID=70993 RepID=UPI000372A8FB|nr:CBS domain-containing protein [Flexithrix dorotheae]